MPNIEIKYEPDYENNDKDSFEKRYIVKDCCAKKHDDNDCCEKKHDDKGYCDKKHDDKDCCAKKHDDTDCYKKERQFHDHEFLGSTRLAELEDDPHNHRFAGVSSPAIIVPCGHVHKVKGRTDFFDHFHEFEATSGLQIPVGDGKHVHFVEAKTSVNDDHCHKLIFATLIEAPIYEECY